MKNYDLVLVKLIGEHVDLVPGIRQLIRYAKYSFYLLASFVYM